MNATAVPRPKPQCLEPQTKKIERGSAIRENSERGMEEMRERERVLSEAERTE